MPPPSGMAGMSPLPGYACKNAAVLWQPHKQAALPRYTRMARAAAQSRQATGWQCPTSTSDICASMASSSSMTMPRAPARCSCTISAAMPANVTPSPNIISR
eukprot:6206417-Pleurochrysis_carterae.AAC.4